MELGFSIFSWIFFVLLLISLGVGLFFLKGWQQNVQVKHLQEVHAENELRRLKIEQEFGTKSFGQSNLQEMDPPDEDQGR